jgi:small-conductance mechanosensitive channel
VGNGPTAAPLSEPYAYYRRLMDAKWSAYRPERKQQRQQEESKESLQGSAKTTGPEQQLSRNFHNQLRADLEKTRKELDSVSRDTKRIAANVEELLKVVNLLAGEVASLKSELEALRTKRK